MAPKNIECIKMLITIALTDGDYLGVSWAPVLECISQLARLHLLSSGLDTDDTFFSNADEGGAEGEGEGGGGGGRRKSRGGGGGGGQNKKSSEAARKAYKFFYGPSRADQARQIEQSNAEQVITEVDTVMIDRVFSSSTRLSGDAIQEFVAQLCKVSHKELNTSAASGTMNLGRARDMQADMNQPRVFSLQRLVEVADFNMDMRGRIVWAKVWHMVERHFTVVALNENLAVSMYAVDSLRQLSLKFLSKDEMAGFSFQRAFLKPFEVIMQVS